MVSGCIDVFNCNPMDPGPDWIIVEMLCAAKYDYEDTARSERSGPIHSMSRHQIGISIVALKNIVDIGCENVSISSYARIRDITSLCSVLVNGNIDRSFREGDLIRYSCRAEPSNSPHHLFQIEG